jgi:hypothetical protein
VEAAEPYAQLSGPGRFRLWFRRGPWAPGQKPDSLNTLFREDELARSGPTFRPGTARVGVAIRSVTVVEGKVKYGFK